MRPIVLGVRNPIPPEGRVTIEVRNARTGKLRHRVVDENAVMDWFSRSVAETLQFGDDTMFSTSYMYPAPYYNGPYNRSLLTGAGNVSREGLMETSRQHLTQISGPNDAPLHYLTGLFLSDNTTAIPTTEQFIPGNIVAGSSSRSVAPSSYNTRVGYLDPSTSYVHVGLSRMEYVFPTDKGNGTFQTVGYGSLIGDMRSSLNSNLILPYLPPGHAISSIYNNLEFGWQYDTWIGITGSNSAGKSFVEGPGQLMEKPHNSTLLVYNNDVFWSSTTTVASAFSITPAAAGNPNTSYQALANWNDTLFILSGTNVWRTWSLPITVSNQTSSGNGTFTGFTDTGILGATSSDTDIYILGQTKVFVMNPTTKAITSSWSHNITELNSLTVAASAGIMWDFVNNRILISYQKTTDLLFPALVSSTSHNYSGRIQFFSPTGTPINTQIAILEGVDSAATWIRGGTANHMRRNGQIMAASRTGTGSTTYYSSLRNPNLKSAVVLDNPVTKTSDDEMRVAYEISFS